MKNVEVNDEFFGSDNHNGIVSSDENDMIDWWVGTVIFAFFPILISIIMSVFRTSSIDLKRMIGDGELILSAFSVSTPSLIRHFTEKTKKNKPFFYLLLLSSFLLLVVYTSIKTNYENNIIVVYIASFLCVISSIIISWKSEEFLKGV